MAISSLAEAEPPKPPGPPGYNEPIAQKPPPPEGSHEEVDNSAHAHDGHPLAGYHNGLFFLRDHHDNFHLYVQGRSQIDWYSYLGSGVTDTVLKPTLFLRRIRPEISGELLGKFRFFISGDFGATAIDNPRGILETSAASPGTAPTPGTARFATAQTVRFSAMPADAFVNYRQSSYFNVMVGQMDLPFTMENRTSDKYLPFMEKSMAVRTVGVPNGGKDLGGMVWGETEDRLFYYSVGPYMGEGMNRPNVDSRFDVYGRIFVHPFAKTTSLAKTDPLRDAQLGTSFHYGSRDKNWVEYDYANLSTAGQWAYWASTYAGSKGNTHILPAGDQLAMAGELRVPIGRFDVTAEAVIIQNGTREAVEGFQATNSERFGTLHGIAYYATLGYWPLGNRDINGVPGYGNPPRLDWTKADPIDPPHALQLLARFEQVSLAYRSASKGGVVDSKNVDGDIKANAFTLGANFWFSRHVRLSLNYVYNAFPDSEPVKATLAGGPQQTPANRAMAPGNTLATGIDDRARDNAHDLHEILARIAIAL